MKKLKILLLVFGVIFMVGKQQLRYEVKTVVAYTRARVFMVDQGDEKIYIPFDNILWMVLDNGTKIKQSDL